MRAPEGPILPHQDFGDPECCGTLWPLIRDGASLDTCTATCPHCGKDNLFAGFSEMLAYLCQHCGAAVIVSDLDAVY